MERLRDPGQAERLRAGRVQRAALHRPVHRLPDKVKYNIGNLEPIANWGADPAVLIVPKDSPFDSARDVVEYAKGNPGRLTVNGAGKFVGHHIAFLQFVRAAGVETTYVPHPKGGAGALKDVMGAR